MKVLITGGSGFVGRALIENLSRVAGVNVYAAVRKQILNLPEGVVQRSFSGLEFAEDLYPLVEDIDVVIHSAARVHIMNDDCRDSMMEYRRVNVEGTLNLASRAAQKGVKRFIFISSIKVNGEITQDGRPFTADDTPAPTDPYGQSKMEAEIGLRELSQRFQMDVVIVRPVLVYGPGVKANFLNMMSWLRRGLPLPLGAVHNQRSLVSLDNLVDLIVTCVGHPKASNQTFLVSDGMDLSTMQLVRHLGHALGHPAKLLPVPQWILELGAAVIGKRAVVQRLCGSLQVDISKTRELLEWGPVISVERALSDTARHYLSSVTK